MKKVILTLCTGIIMSGAAYSLYNAANDYGLATISLPPAIVAQDDDTSGGDNTNGDNTNGGKIECDGVNVLCGFYLDKIFESCKVESNDEGYLEALGLKIGGYKKNTAYTVFVSKRSCKLGNASTICIRAEEGVFKEKVQEGDGTNGDSTNGDSTNGN